MQKSKTVNKETEHAIKTKTVTMIVYRHTLFVFQLSNIERTLQTKYKPKGLKYGLFYI